MVAVTPSTQTATSDYFLLGSEQRTGAENKIVADITEKSLPCTEKQQKFIRDTAHIKIKPDLRLSAYESGFEVNHIFEHLLC